MKILIYSLLMASTAASSAAPPTWLSRITPNNPAAVPPLPPTELNYSLTWKGMVAAGKLSVTLGKKDPTFPRHYVASATGSSTGAAARIFPYSFHFTSLIDRRTRVPQRFLATEKDKHSTVMTSASFSPTGVHATEIETPIGSTVSTTSISDLPYPGVLDLFSSLLFVRSQKLDAADSVVLVSHPTTRGQLITVRVLGREKINGLDAIKLSVALERIQPDLTLKPYNKLKSATLWLSDDANRIPLELRADVFIGDVRMSLTSFTIER